MGHVVGIDLGTTNSCVAVSEGRHTTVIPNRGGYRTTPSVVAILEDKRTLVGQLAKRQSILNPENTIYSAKRLIGRRMDSPEVKMAKVIYPYELVEGDRGDIRIQCHEKEFTLQQISSVVLVEMKRIAESYLGEEIHEAVITVPAYFNDAQRQATKDAGRIAGLEVIRIINEPTAAAIAYGFNKRNNKKIAIYDLGGGTFDISILEIHDGVFKVIAVSGDTFLGGDDFDNALMTYVADAFKQNHAIDVRRDRMSLQRLRDACEKAKCELSFMQEVEINLPFIESAGKEASHLTMTIARKTFEGLVEGFVAKTLDICKRCLQAARLDRNDLDDVLMVGGQTRMPTIVDRVSNFFGRSATQQINPDEAVAIGAAIQGLSLKSGTQFEMLLLDVTSQPLGIKSAHGTFTRLIDANTTVPVSARKIFTTVSDNQESVRIEVYQGGSPDVKENVLLGEFVLEGIRRAKAGVPEVDVTLHIDANGIVHVSAKDLSTGRQQSIKVTMTGSLKEEEIEELRKETADTEIGLRVAEEAESLAQKAEVLHYRLNKAFESKKESIPDENKNLLLSLIQAAPGFIEKKEISQLKTLVESLEKALKDLA